jgi:hypothetical protein
MTTNIFFNLTRTPKFTIDLKPRISNWIANMFQRGHKQQKSQASLTRTPKTSCSQLRLLKETWTPNLILGYIREIVAFAPSKYLMSGF